MPDVLNVIMRWLHISSAATLVGGLLFARAAAAPASRALPPEDHEKLGDRAATAFRPFAFAAMTGLVISGVYTLLSNPGHTVKYHVVLGIKLLLAAHVFAVTMLATQPAQPRRERMATGAVISGLIIILIAAYLRRIF